MNARCVEAARVVECKRVDAKSVGPETGPAIARSLSPSRAGAMGALGSLAASAALKLEASKIAEIEIRAAERVI